MFAAMKVLVPIGMGLVGLVAFSQKAKAEPGKPSGVGGGAKPSRAVPTPRTGSMTTEQVVREMTAAIASADPKLLLALADKLEKAGFPEQAKDMRGVADALSKVGAAAAGTTPAPSPTKPATPIAQIPTAPPAAPISVPPPVVAVTPPPVTSPGIPQGNVTTLPEMVVTASGPSTQERGLASQLVINQQTKPKWQDNRDLTALFQNQEAKAGTFKNIMTGEPGKIDSLYGPGTAIVLAERYGIVPPNPKYWPTNPAPSLSKYKARLLQLAANDPARATEWQQASNNAKVIK